MPTATPSTGKSANKRSAASKSGAAKRKSAPTSRSKDAVALLKADHREVERLFGQFEKASNESRKQPLAEQICLELKIHTQIEEEIFYPTSREFLKDDEIVNEALVEHQAAKELIEQIEAMEPSDEMFEAKMKVLQEQIEHHVQEEEKELFPQVQKSDMDLKSVGEQLMMRKKELMEQMSPGMPAMH